MTLFDNTFGALLQSFFLKRNYELVNYNEPERKEINAIINKIRKETELAMLNTAAQELFIATKATSKVEGDIAEVGVYKGGSAKVICMAKGDRKLHLFDTFKGLPKPGKYDSPELSREGQFYSDLVNVKRYLSEFPNVQYYEGMFPGTAGPVEKTRFSFVHLDVDLYESTVDCLKFFYPRMNQGGVIISHDYGFLSGINKAYEEFFMDKPEIVLGLPGYQCLVVKQ